MHFKKEKKWSAHQVGVGIKLINVGIKAELTWGPRLQHVGPKSRKGQSLGATSPLAEIAIKLPKIAKNSTGLRKIHRKIW